MSHWKKFESSVLDNVKMSILEKATKELGVEMSFDIKSIKNAWGQEEVSCGLVKDGRPIALGYNFTEKDGKVSLELSGDFYSTGLDERTYIDRLAQEYKKHDTMEILNDQGWTIDSMTMDENGEYQIEAYSYM